MSIFSRLIAVLASFGAVGLAVYADELEVRRPLFGSAAWVMAIFIGIVLILWQARRTGKPLAICLVALVPFVNLILIPVCVLVLATLPSKEVAKLKDTR